MNKTVITIPTYWTWDSERPAGPAEAIFDHPTPVDGESTLPRLLNSLCQIVGSSFTVWVLTATVHSALQRAAEQRVAEIVAPFRERFPIAQFTVSDLAALRERMRERITNIRLRRGEFAPLFSLRSYPGVRNCQLAISHAMGAEVIIALDDDEIVDPDYVERARHFVGRVVEGVNCADERVLGLAGLYLDAGGNTLLPESLPTGNIFLDKSAIMNEGAWALQRAPGRLVDTPIAFGGNMLFHRDLFTCVGFDPSITRGEDIDYLINARLVGHRFWLDKKLFITHLPPGTHNTPPYAKLAQDVCRFVYEREKLQLTGADPAQFDPYPGRFLRDDVAPQALAALEALATPEAVNRFGSPKEIVAIAERGAREAALSYLEFAARWPGLMEAIGQDAELRERLLARFDRPA